MHPRAWRLAGRGTGIMQSSCGVDSRSWGWKVSSKMRCAEFLFDSASGWYTGQNLEIGMA